MTLVSTAERSKVNLQRLELINSPYLIRFNILSENNDFGFNSIQTINFSKKIPFKCFGKQI